MKERPIHARVKKHYTREGRDGTVKSRSGAPLVLEDRTLGDLENSIMGIFAAVTA